LVIGVAAAGAALGGSSFLVCAVAPVAIIASAAALNSHVFVITRSHYHIRRDHAARRYLTQQKGPLPCREASLFSMIGPADQPARVPVIGKLPNAPAPTVPVSVSPSIVAWQSSVIGIGTVIFIFHEMVLPSTLPSLTSVDPIAPELVPVKVAPSLFTVSVDFWSPNGDLVTHSHVPSTSAIIVSP
jgi:hypothetical protein